uniref:SclB protein n=1 Tax=uncultured bacterium contig00104 TaxID=1181571 RepID=A0A806K2S2_9BACT|nr:SclB protein [uncultured bacterium contig00104]
MYYHEYGGFCVDGVVYAICNEKTYNTDTHFCKNGTVTEKCGGQPYWEDLICENGVVKRTCGEELFQIDTQRCGENNVVETRCGTLYYSPYYTASTHFCHNNQTIIELCNGQSYDAGTKFCLNNNIEDLCNGKEYGTGQICINNVVYATCGAESTPYNTQTFFCFENTKSYAKCNGEAYNPTINVCENNILKSHCGTELYDPKTDFCTSDVITPLCDGKEFNIESNFCLGNAITPKCGGKEYASGQLCLNGVVYGRCNGNMYNVETHICVDGNAVETKCDGTPYNPLTQYCFEGTTVKEYGTLNYEGQTYKTIVIGSQTWMAKNLNYDVSGSKCYDNSDANCDTYGRLYDWATAMNLPSSCNSSACAGQVPHQGICPDGWHIPNDDEWTILTTDVGSMPGTKLKAVSGWYSNGTDDYGFAALPGNGGYSGGFFVKGFGNTAIWWSTTESGSNYAYNWYIYDEDIIKQSDYKSYLLSVRCVQN